MPTLPIQQSEPHRQARPVIAITCGEPAGIGPEISIRAAWALREQINAVLIGDATLLTRTAAAIDPAIRLGVLSLPALQKAGRPQFVPGQVVVVDCPLPVPVVPGVPDARNGLAVLQTLDIAIEGAAEQGWFDAIVTAPLQKSTINDAAVAAVAFTGHTEYLAQKTDTAQVVMLLAGATGEPGALPLSDAPAPMLRVALATTHLPLKEVAAALTFDSLAATIDILHHDLQHRFGLRAPRILVAGLNPHAGEAGYLGREEIDVIIPVLQAARQKGLDVRGPYPADTLFQPKYLQDADCVLAMYHDQGLPVLKYATFGRGVNITLGLPMIRTSVDHGTALDVAAQGPGHADYGSMIEAIRVAVQMVQMVQMVLTQPLLHQVPT